MASCPDIRSYILTDHARWEMQRRGVSEAAVVRTLHSPDRREEVRPGRCVYQSLFECDETQRQYLLRVFVDVDRFLPEVVTVYCTSKVKKYWR
jgi:hypothetical protein